jgi:hypothetical protein
VTPRTLTRAAADGKKTARRRRRTARNGTAARCAVRAADPARVAQHGYAPAVGALLRGGASVAPVMPHSAYRGERHLERLASGDDGAAASGGGC